MRTHRLARWVIVPLAAAVSMGVSVESLTATVQPALSAAAAPRAAELSEAGIEKIVARTGNHLFDIQVTTVHGPAYFAWPRGVTPTPFELDVGPGTSLAVRADGYTDASRAQYAAALDAVLPEAVRSANNVRERAMRPRP